VGLPPLTWPTSTGSEQGLALAVVRLARPFHALGMGVLLELFPQLCAGCKLPGQLLCRNCGAQLGLSPRPVTRPLLSTGTSFIPYQGAARTVLHQLKSGGSVTLAGLLAARMFPDAGVASLALAGSRVLVPAPSRRQANRTRGFSPAALLAQALAARGRLLGLDLVVHQPLRFARTVQDQKLLDRAGRQVNLEGSMVASPPVAGGRFGAGVAIIDDVVTTGATLREATRALAQAGWQPLTFVTFAETL